MLTEVVALGEMIGKINDFCMYWLLLDAFSKALQAIDKQCRSREGRDCSFAERAAVFLRTAI